MTKHTFSIGEEYTSKDLWLEVKATVRKVEREDAVLIFDDTCRKSRTLMKTR